MTRIALFLAAAAAMLCLNVSASQAQYYGDAQWCAVTAMGTGGVHYDCEYNNVEACVPNVLAGNRGFCALNPYYGHGTGYGSTGWQEPPPVTHHPHPHYYPHYSRHQSYTSRHQPHQHSHQH